ncbi:MAG: hypothetical protein ACI9CD_001048 [Candidatus Deianiraeaceae bacterium]|jgi:hypothetical protein
MKYLVLILLASVFSLFANAKSIDVNYKGIKCQSCVKKFDKSFHSYSEKNNGVVLLVNVDWENKHLTIETIGDTDIPDDVIVDILTTHGYTLGDIKRK